VPLPTGHSPILNGGRCGLALLRGFLNAPTSRLRTPAACARATAARATGAPWEGRGALR